MKVSFILCFILSLFLNYLNVKAQEPLPYRQPLNPSQNILIQLHESVTRIEKRLNQRQAELDRISAKLKNLWTYDRPANITAPIVIKGSLVTNELNARRIVLPISPVFLPSRDGPAIRRQVQEKSAVLAGILDKAEKEFVLRSRAAQTIRGSIIFKGAVRVAKATFDQLSVQSHLNQVSVGYVNDKVLRKSRNQVIDGSWVFQTPIKAKLLNVTNQLSGVSIADILQPRSNSYQWVNGRLTVSRAFFTHLSVNKLNDVPLQDYIRRNSPVGQTIDGQKHFKSIKVHNVAVSGLINEKNLTDILGKSIAIDRPLLISKDFLFTNPINVKHLKVKHIKHDKREPIDVNYVLSEAVTPFGNNVITGKKIFTSLNARNVTVRNTLKGIKVPDDLVPLNQPIVITSKVNFQAPVILNRGLNVRTINNVNPTRDLVLRNTSEVQFISGEKRFLNGLSVEQPVIIDQNGRVNRLTPQQLENRLRQVNYSPMNRDYTYYGLEINGDLTVEWLNGRKVADLPFILLSKTRNQTINAPVNVKKTLKVATVTVPKINDHYVPQDLVLVNSRKPEVITARKEFTTVISNNLVYFTSNAYLNGHDKRFLNSILHHNNSNQLPLLVRGHKRFTDLTVNGNVITGQKLINRINMSNILVRDQEQLITGYKTFLGPVEVRDRLDAYDSRVNILNNYKIADLRL